MSYVAVDDQGKQVFSSDYKRAVECELMVLTEGDCGLTKEEQKCTLYKKYRK